MPQQNSIEKFEFVMVIKGDIKPPVQKFIGDIKSQGLIVQIKRGQKVDRMFILLFMPPKILEKYAEYFDTFKMKRAGKHNIKSSEEYHFTSAQKLLILTRLLETVSFGPKKGEFGLTRLIKSKLIETAYPLHDGSYNGSQECERKQLWNKWVNNSFRVDQPLDDIQAYFGWEIGFYFAWLEHFIRMLIPAAILGILIFISSMLTEFIADFKHIKEICRAHDIYICPICDYRALCIFRRLSSYCFYAKWTFVFDNTLAVCFAVIMSFWATLVVKLWRRKESVLKYKWDAEYPEYEIIPRRGYVYKQNLPDFCNKLLRANILKHLKALKISLTISTIICLVISMAAAYLAIIAYRIPLPRVIVGTHVYEEMMTIFSGSLLLVVFIVIFDRIYQKVAIVLTNLENPKYQNAYDKSALYKRFFLSLVNNNSFLFYIAFLKGKFFSTPLQKNIFLLERDTCQPFSCVIVLSIQLTLLMLIKRLIWNMCLLVYLKLKIYRKKSTSSTDSLPAHENDYNLEVLNQDFFLDDFCESAIEFGYVTFFVAACPLAPSIALLNNMILKHLRSSYLVSMQRRPCPKMKCGIDEWNGVFQGLSYLGTATSAFATGFAGDFIWRERYYWQTDSSLKGYFKSTLSSFATKDSAVYSEIGTDVEICYYKAFRQPFYVSNKYEYSQEMWVNLALRFIHVFVFEHIIFACNLFLGYVIPDIPFSIKEQKTLEQQLANRAKLETISGKADAER